MKVEEKNVQTIMIKKEFLKFFSDLIEKLFHGNNRDKTML